MNDNSFQINDVSFKCFKISPFKQFHIVRKMGAILADLMPVAAKFSKMSPDQLGEDQTEALAPLLNGFAKLSDDDANKILIGLLSGVEMQQPQGNWARLANDEMLLFQNLDLPTMLQAAGRSFMFNLSGFFSALPSALPNATQKPKKK